MFKQIIITLCLMVLLGISVAAGEIHQAADSGDVAALKILLESNSDLVNSPDSIGSLPLHRAALRGHLDAVKLLVESGADISAGDRDNTSPIVCACIGGHLEVARYLAGLGASVTEADNYGQTAISTASRSGNIELVDFLLTKGADIQYRDNQGRGLLHILAFRGQTDMLKHLVDIGADLDIRDNDSMSVLCGAAYSGQANIIEALIELGCDVNEEPNRHGHTPLFAAIWNNRPEVIELLLVNGVDFNFRNNEGGTALHIAASRGNTEIAQLLIDHGLDINVTNNFGEKPIGEAAWNEAGMVQWLINHGAEVNASADSLPVPLMTAIHGNNTEAVRILINAGADVNRGHRGDIPLLVAASRGNIDILRILLENGADVNIRGSHYGRSLLHYSAIYGQSEIAELLISRGAEIDALDRDNHTPLYYAAKYCNRNVADRLKENGANSKDIEENYNTPAQLSESPAKGEAVIWYLGHSGWGIKTSNHFLIFDYYEPFLTPDNPCLKNGYIATEELAKTLSDTKVYVFSSHEHGDHYDTTIFGWRDDFPNITYVLGHQPEDQNGYEYLPPRTDKSIGDLHVWTIPATDAGVGYLLEVDGLTIFHAGDHANGEVGLHAEYTDEIDYLAGLGKQIDLAFLPITGCSLGTPESVREGVYYGLEKLQPKVFVPQHGGTAGYIYREFADAAREAGFTMQINCVENGGDSFKYDTNGSL